MSRDLNLISVPLPGPPATGQSLILAAVSREPVDECWSLLTSAERALRAANRELRRAWIEWLNAHKWSHFVTLTSSAPLTREALTREFTQRFIRRLAWLAGQAIPWFRVFEIGKSGEKPHVHCLLAGTELLAIERIRAPWTLGNTDARVYDATLGAAAYLTKEMSARPDDYDISGSRLPRRDVQTVSLSPGALRR